VLVVAAEMVAAGGAAAVAAPGAPAGSGWSPQAPGWVMDCSPWHGDWNGGAWIPGAC